MTPHEVPGTTSLQACQFLAKLAADVREDHDIVELGVYLGRTLCFLAGGARTGNGAHITGIDIFMSEGRRDRHAVPCDDAWFNVEACGLGDVVTLIEGRSEEVAKGWGGGPVGLLYVDATHTYDAVRRDFGAWESHLADDAIVVFDDYDAIPRHAGVRRAVDQLIAEGRLARFDVRHERLAVCHST